MKWLLLAVLALFFPAGAQAQVAYTPAITGNVAGFRLAGVEPDGDPLDEVVLNTTLAPSHGIPRLHLVVDTYLENFSPDTTPILPDLLHPNRNAQNLGGFLQGKSLLTDDAGNVLYIGSFLAEAFLDNSNHVVTTLDGTDAARGGRVTLKGTFSLQKRGTLSGNLSGNISLPAAARRQIAAHDGDRLRPVKSIIGTVTVKPHPMVGRSTRGSSPPLHTGYGSNPSRAAKAPAAPRRFSPLTIGAAIGAVLAFAAAGVLWWWQRRTSVARGD